MIAFDTNLLVRYLIHDDESQCKKVDDLIDRYQGSGTIFLSTIVLVETEWVLHSIYKFTHDAIADAFETIISIEQFYFNDRELLKRALKKYKNGARDFSDALIGEEGKTRRLKTYTFDKHLRHDDNFLLL
jgi:predicted nucleic-acid-binding protein